MKLVERISAKLAGKQPLREPIRKTPGETNDTYDLANWPDGTGAHEHCGARKHRHHDARNRFSLPMSAH